MPPRTRTPVSRRDRPAKPPLTREGIVDVAMKIMNEEGLDAATMRRVARELDTGPASLYVYVRNSAELHGAMLDRLLDDIDLDVPAAHPAWRERLVTMLTAYTTLLLPHPGLARSVQVLRPSGRNYLLLFDAVLSLLRAGGASARQAAWGADILLQLATATAVEQGTRRETTGEDDTAAMERAMRSAADAGAGNIAWAQQELFSGTGPQRLAWSLHVLIAGITADGATAET